MGLEDVTAALKKLRREVVKGSAPSVKREQVLYSALLDLVEYVEELDINSDLASIGDFGPRLRRLDENRSPDSRNAADSVSLTAPLWTDRGGIAPPSGATRPSSRLEQYPARSYLVTVPVAGRR